MGRAAESPFPVPVISSGPVYHATRSEEGEPWIFLTFLLLSPSFRPAAAKLPGQGPDVRPAHSLTRACSQRAGYPGAHSRDQSQAHQQ